jgi:RimJ/RimL family protein N-acetyltransferase
MLRMPSVPDRPILRGEKVWLRPFEKEDFGISSIEDVDLAHYAGFRRSFSRMETEQFLQQLAGQERTGEVMFAICMLGSEAPIGNCGLRNVDRLNGSAEVAIAIVDPAQWSKGLGTDAMRVLVDYGFGEMRLERIWLRVFDYNPRAVRSYEKARFVKEVLLRHDRFHRGAYHDVHLMAIIRADWLADDRRRAWDD